MRALHLYGDMVSQHSPAAPPRLLSVSRFRLHSQGQGQRIERHDPAVIVEQQGLHAAGRARQTQDLGHVEMPAQLIAHTINLLYRMEGCGR